MNIRKTWNLWVIGILPFGFLLFGTIGTLLFFGPEAFHVFKHILLTPFTEFPQTEELSNDMYLKGFCASMVSVLWCVLTVFYLIPRRCRCPKCKRPLRLYSYQKLWVSPMFYWRSDLNLNCKNCGNPLNNNDDKC